LTGACAPGNVNGTLDQAGGTVDSSIERIDFYFFHSCSYNDIPEDADRYHATWVDYPNRLFDPEKGHDLYRKHLRLFRLAEELGFPGVALNEHHNTQFSMTPSVSVLAGAVAVQTERVRILVAGVPVNLEYPNRVAEEYAMLDVLSGGRMEFAFPLGTGMEYWANASQINPVTARARFRESLDVILKAWTEDGPTRYDGDFYNYRFLNSWPRPYQKPHPKIFIVGSGSAETVELAVEYGAGYSIVFVPIPAQLRAFERMRELAAERGRAVPPEDIVVVVMAHVAETDEEAIGELRPHVETFFSWSHRVPPKYLLPPGYVSTAEYLRRASDAGLAHGTEATWDDMIAIMRIACGSPETVADTLVEWAREAGCSRMNVIFELSDMPEWKVVKSMTMFAQEVMPLVQARLAEAHGARSLVAAS
jgi:alkanesulfonate monooxygenase SsuD/methylene tetrahydromethanopterin reductase-like flavin-dependent oxidoreductase (luciferase family)